MTKQLSEEDDKKFDFAGLGSYGFNPATSETRLTIACTFPKVVFIPGRLPGANEYINACRADSRKGNEA